MAVTFVAASTTAPAGTTTTSGTASVTPALPTGTAIGDRVYLFQSASNASVAPTGWTQLYKDVRVGETTVTPGAAIGRRYLSGYYRDRDTAWAMPAMTVTSTTNNSNAAMALTLRKDAADTWDAPTFSSPGHDVTSDTAWSVDIPAFTTNTGALLISHSAHNGGAAAASGQTMTQPGAVFANIVEQYDQGTTVGNDVRLVVGTCNVTTGATGVITRTAVLSGAATGGTQVIQQTVTSPASASPGLASGVGSWVFAGSATGRRAPGATATGAFTFAGAGSGKRSPKGAANGSWTSAGTASGQRTPRAGSAGSWSMAGTATGSAPVVGSKNGSAAGTWTFSGTATGRRAPRGAATGALGWAGAAVGATPAVATRNGTATGAWAFAGAATGRRIARATATGLVTFTGLATGHTVERVVLPPLTQPVAAAFVGDGEAPALFGSDGKGTGAFDSNGSGTATFTSNGVGAASYA